MGQYRKRPVVIEALQWDGTEVGAIGIAAWADSHDPEKVIVVTPSPDSRVTFATGLAVRTLEGTMRASDGDWIIRGTQGEFYPCKPDIFEQIYEAVNG